MTATVLVVDADPVGRRRIGDWLAEEGFGIMPCPGPSAPDYVCLGGKGLPCPLPQAADVVVLDLELNSDDAAQGTPAWALLSYYLAQGKPVVALSHHRDRYGLPQQGDLMVLPSVADKKSLVGSVKRFLSILEARRSEIGNPRSAT